MNPPSADPPTRVAPQKDGLHFGPWQNLFSQPSPAEFTYGLLGVIGCGLFFTVIGLFVVLSSLRLIPGRANGDGTVLAIAYIVLGVALLVGAVGMSRRQKWGWVVLLLVAFLTAPVLCTDRSAHLPVLVGAVLFLGWWLRSASLTWDYHRVLEPYADSMATALGVDWTRTPFRMIGDLVNAGRDDEAVTAYRDQFGCGLSEAQMAIHQWRGDTTRRKLLYLEKVLNERHTENATPNS